MRTRVIGLLVITGGLAILGFATWPAIRAHFASAPPPSQSQFWPYPYKVGRSSANEREIAFYQKKVKERPTSAPDFASLASAYLKQARITMEPGWYLLAEKAARESMAHQPIDNRAALLVLARVAEARHDFTDALDLLARAGAEHDDTLSIKVTSLLALGDVPKARAAAELLVKQAPAPSNYGLLALTQIASGDDDGAVDSFTRGLRREEAGEQYTSAWLRVMLARFSARRGRGAMARDLYQEALRILPDYPLALAGLAELDVLEGDLVGADRAYDQAWTIAQQPAWQIARARIMQLQGNTSKARATLEETRGMLETQLEGGSFGHRRDLARLYLQRGGPDDPKRAADLMRDETKRRRDAETLDVLAAALLASGMPTEALAAEQEALRWGLRDAEMQRRLAEIQRALGHEDEARRADAEARSINPMLK